MNLDEKKLIIKRIIYEAHKESVCVLFGIPTMLHHALYEVISLQSMMMTHTGQNGTEWLNEKVGIVSMQSEKY